MPFRWMYFAEPIDRGPLEAHLLKSDDNKLNQRYRYLLIQSQVNQSIYLCNIWQYIFWCQHCGYTGICDLASPTPLEHLLDDGGSLPASKRVSGTQARLWIEGVWVPRPLQHRRLGPVLLKFPKWRLTYWQMVSTSREPIASLDLRYVLVYRAHTFKMVA